VLVDLRRKGLIRHVGLSNVTAAQIAEAHAITEVAVCDRIDRGFARARCGQGPKIP
jgi:aryl-alcohol dehydrogenase-like predicted oxidoreductase